MTPLTTPIFDFHQVVSSLTTPTPTPTPTPSLDKTSLKITKKLQFTVNNYYSMHSFYLIELGGGRSKERKVEKTPRGLY